MGQKQRRFIDLFAGIGGFHVGLARQGLACVFASEIDAAAAAAYQANFRMAPAGDISTIEARDIPAHDVLCAGFPCQPFSRAGKRQGLEDDRGQLFHEIVRIAKHHQPELLLLENVPTILTIDGGAAQREIYARLDEIGYRLQHVVLNAGDYGLPQRRQRVYFVGIRRDADMTFRAPPHPLLTLPAM